jgi:hypothetical protein
MTAEVLEYINLKNYAFDKWLSSKQGVVHREIYKEKKKIASKAVIKTKMKCGTNHVRNKL